MIYRINTDLKTVDIEFIDSEKDKKNLITLKKFFKSQDYTIFERYKDKGKKIEYTKYENTRHFIPGRTIVTGTGTTITLTEDYTNYTGTNTSGITVQEIMDALTQTGNIIVENKY